MEEVIKRLTESILKNKYHIYQNTLKNDVKSLIKGYRELEKENKSIKEANIYWTERYCKVNNDSIQKSKVKEMIEKKKKRIDTMHPASDCVLIDDLENQIEVLQELLEDK